MHQHADNDIDRERDRSITVRRKKKAVVVPKDWVIFKPHFLFLGFLWYIIFLNKVSFKFILTGFVSFCVRVVRGWMG